MRKFILPLIFVLAGTSFVTYSFLDAFVIPKNTKKVNLNDNVNDFFDISSSKPISVPTSSIVQSSSEAPISSSINEPKPPVEYYEDLTNEQINALFTPTIEFREKEHYSDPDIYIDITTHRNADDSTTYYVADIRLKDLRYLKTALAKDTFGENVEERTSDICKRNKGILAINGDYYGAQEKGYVLRNGKILRSTVSASYGNNSRAKPEDLAFYRDGTFEIFNEKEVSLQEIADKGAWQVFSFGPGLIKDGEIIVSEKEEVGTALSGGRNQRTAIGMISPLHYIFFCNDGRLTDEKGMPLYEVASLMKELHCYQAYNLDGGGSSTMYLDDGTGNANKLGHLVNKPTQNFREATGKIEQRTVSDIVYIGK